VFVERTEATTAIVTFVEHYLPIGAQRQRYVFDTISGVIDARGSAGAIALLMLGWATMRSLSLMIRIVNRAWRIEAAAWWRLGLKGLTFLVLVIALLPVAIIVPPLLQKISTWLFPESWIASSWADVGRSVATSAIAFSGLSLFYKFAPRRWVPLSRVWPAALCSAALLEGAGWAFSVYLRHFASLNAVYGTFGGIMALLLWIYLSGSIFIFGACLCATSPRKTAEATATRRVLMA
jgi:Ca2+-transporting ATPase